MTPFDPTSTIKQGGQGRQNSHLVSQQGCQAGVGICKLRAILDGAFQQGLGLLSMTMEPWGQEKNKATIVNGTGSRFSHQISDSYISPKMNDSLWTLVSRGRRTRPCQAPLVILSGRIQAFACYLQCGFYLLRIGTRSTLLLWKKWARPGGS